MVTILPYISKFWESYPANGSKGLVPALSDEDFLFITIYEPCALFRSP